MAQAGVLRLMELARRRSFPDGFPPAYLSRVAYTLEAVLSPVIAITSRLPDVPDGQRDPTR